MSKNKLLKSALLAALAFGIAGCADYMNHYDTVTLEAGNAQRHNRLLHAEDPFNPDAKNTEIDTSGERAVDAVEEYENSKKPGAQQPSNVTVNIGT